MSNKKRKEKIITVKTIIDVDYFKEQRPDMAIFGDEFIKSAINFSSTLLDGKCYGLIHKVWVFYRTSNSDIIIDPLYRTDWEIDQIKEAFIVQTQYQLNIGNDFSQGSENFSIGGLSSSFQRPIDRDVLAMGVVNLLQNARVFKLQNMFNPTELVEEEVVEECHISGFNGNSMFTPINRTIGDKRYLRQFQGSWPIGNVLSVGPNNIIQSSNPEDVVWKNKTADLIKDWKFNDYKAINEITDLAFFGNNSNNAMTRSQIVELVSERYKAWSPNKIYNISDIVYYIFESNVRSVWKYRIYLSLTQNIDKQPNMHPLDWQMITDIDINDIITAATNGTIAHFKPLFNEFKTEIDTEMNNFEEEVKTTLIPNEVEKQLNELPTIENVVFAEGTTTLFTDETQFVNTKLKYSITDSDYVINYDTGDLLRHNAGNFKIDDTNILIRGENFPTGRYNLLGGIWLNGGVYPLTVSWLSEDETGTPPVAFFIKYDKTLTPNLNEPMGIVLNGNSTQIALTQEGQTISCKSAFLVTWLKDIVKKGAIKGDVANLVFLKGDDKCIILKEAFKNNSTILKRYGFKSSLGRTYYFEDIDTSNSITFNWITVTETYYGITNTCKVYLTTPINFESTIEFTMIRVITQLREPQYAMKKGQLYTGMLMSEWKDTVRDVDDPYVWWDANANSRYIHINLMRKVGSTYQVQLDANANKDDNETSNVGRLFTRTITTTIAISDTTTLANVIQNITDIAYADKNLIFNQNDIAINSKLTNYVKKYVFSGFNLDSTSTATNLPENLKTIMDATYPGVFDDWVANKHNYVIQAPFESKSQSTAFGNLIQSLGITTEAPNANLFYATSGLQERTTWEFNDPIPYNITLMGNVDGSMRFAFKFNGVWNSNGDIKRLILFKIND